MLGRLSRAEVKIEPEGRVGISLLNDYGQPLGVLDVALNTDANRSDIQVLKINLAREIVRRINGSPHL